MSAVNVSIISNPLNWIIIFLMLVFAALIAETIFQLTGNAPCGCHKSGAN